MKLNYGLSIFDGDTINSLDNSRNPKKPIVGTPWYNALFNPEYSQRFGYIGSFTGERHKLLDNDIELEKDENGKDIWTPEMIRYRVEQSDIVMILMYLGFIPDSVIK